MKRMLIFSLVFLFCLARVLAVSGVTPASFDVDFEPNLEKTFTFEFVIDGLKIVDLDVQGDLAKYVTLDTNKVAARQKVKATLKLPDSIDKPGPNEIRIVAGNVFGVIRVNVPYPEKYVDLDLSAPDTNEGEVINVKLNILNKGEVVGVDPRLEFYRVENGTSSIVNVMSLNETQVVKSYTYDLKIVPGGYTAGNYVVVAYVDYGDGFARVNNSFRVGEKSVEITDYTNKIKEGRVSKFNLGVNSTWNSDIESLYMEVKLDETDYSFVSTSVPLRKWGHKELTGFFDARGLSPGIHNLDVVIYFDGESVEKTVSVEIYQGFDLIFVLVIIGSLVSIFFISWMWIRFRKSVREVEEQTKK